jgi:hypothetical protein
MQHEQNHTHETTITRRPARQRAPNKTERMNPVGREEEYPTHETAITQRSAHKTAITPPSTKNIHYTHETQTK